MYKQDNNVYQELIMNYFVHIQIVQIQIVIMKKVYVELKYVMIIILLNVFNMMVVI